MYQSPQSNYRNHLLDLIRTFAENQQLGRTTVHLTVYVMDIFMDNHKIYVDRLKLVAMVCLLLACKIEERELKIPKVFDLNRTIQNQYAVADYIALEKMVLTFMDWSLIIPTAAQFVEYYIGAVITELDFRCYVEQFDETLAKFTSFSDMKLVATDYVFEFLDISLTGEMNINN